jgi:hypothetical protein
MNITKQLMMTAMVLLLQVFPTLSSSGQELGKLRKTARVIGEQVEIRARAIDGGIQLRFKLSKAIGIGQPAIPETEEADFSIFRDDIPKFIELIEDDKPGAIRIGFNIMNRKDPNEIVVRKNDDKSIELLWDGVTVGWRFTVGESSVDLLKRLLQWGLRIE